MRRPGGLAVVGGGALAGRASSFAAPTARADASLLAGSALALGLLAGSALALGLLAGSALALRSSAWPPRQALPPWPRAAATPTVAARPRRFGQRSGGRSGRLAIAWRCRAGNWGRGRGSAVLAGGGVGWLPHAVTTNTSATIAPRRIRRRPCSSGLLCVIETPPRNAAARRLVVLHAVEGRADRARLSSRGIVLAHWNSVAISCRPPQTSCGRNRAALHVMMGQEPCPAPIGLRQLLIREHPTRAGMRERIAGHSRRSSVSVMLHQCCLWAASESGRRCSRRTAHRSVSSACADADGYRTLAPTVAAPPYPR